MGIGYSLTMVASHCLPSAYSIGLPQVETTVVVDHFRYNGTMVALYCLNCQYSQYWPTTVWLTVLASAYGNGLGTSLQLASVYSCSYCLHGRRLTTVWATVVVADYSPELIRCNETMVALYCIHCWYSQYWPSTVGLTLLASGWVYHSSS